MNIFRTKFFEVQDKIGFFTSQKKCAAIVDKIFYGVLGDLSCDAIKNFKIILTVCADKSEYQNNKIYVSPYTKNTSNDNFKMLLKHESIHFITKKTWGDAPAIFNEGIAVYFADNRIRQKQTSINYHAYCKILLKNHRLYPLKGLIESHKYLGRRYDYRVDLEGGSFIGFLIEKYGLGKLKLFFQNYQKPTPDKPVNQINKLCEKIYGKTLFAIEMDWVNFLKISVPYIKKGEIICSKSRKFYKIIPIKHGYCKFCNTPMDGELLCPSCNADN